ncbi:MAG: hypothetical protein ABIA47_01305 [bacterium]
MDFSKYQKAKWYVELMERYRMLMEKLHVPEDVSSEFKVFLLECAHSQYMAGNRSGIRWQREQSGLPVRQGAS